MDAEELPVRLCAVCGTVIDTMEVYYMVRHEVWAAAGIQHREHAHIECLSRRLGRPLTMDDFMQDAPVNNAILFGYCMGRRNLDGRLAELEAKLARLLETVEAQKGK